MNERSGDCLHTLCSGTAVRRLIRNSSEAGRVWLSWHDDHACRLAIKEPATHLTACRTPSRDEQARRRLVAIVPGSPTWNPPRDAVAVVRPGRPESPQ